MGAELRVPSDVDQHNKPTRVYSYLTLSSWQMVCCEPDAPAGSAALVNDVQTHRQLSHVMTAWNFMYRKRLKSRRKRNSENILTCEVARSFLCTGKSRTEVSDKNPNLDWEDAWNHREYHVNKVSHMVNGRFVRPWGGSCTGRQDSVLG